MSQTSFKFQKVFELYKNTYELHLSHQEIYEDLRYLFS